MSFKDVVKDYHEIFGFNLLLLKNKAPQIDCEVLHCKSKSPQDMDLLFWNTISNGIVTTRGINNIRYLNFDAVSDGALEGRLISKFASKLGLPENYTWIVKAATGRLYLFSPLKTIYHKFSSLSHIILLNLRRSLKLEA